MTLKRILIPLFLLLGSQAALAANPHVVIKTNMGDIEVELFKDKAPISVANFLSYVDDKYYDGTIFHRVIGSFMVQGGGFDKALNKKKTKAAIKNEATNRVSNKRGTLAMARTGVVDSATSQFFINVVDNDRLDHFGTNPRRYGYAVFGQVVKGMDVVDKIRNVKTGSCGPFRSDCPANQVVMQSVRRAKAGAKAAPAPKKKKSGGGW